MKSGRGAAAPLFFFRQALPGLLLALFVGAMPAGGHAQACRGQFALAGAAGTLVEQAPSATVREQAFWPGIGVDFALPANAAAAACLELELWLRGGLGTYDGHTQAGLPHSTDVTHTDFGAALHLLIPHGEQVRWEALLGPERFSRAIAAQGTVGAITEHYTWYWLGAGGRWTFCAHCRFPLSVRATHALLLDGGSAVNLYTHGQARLDFDRGWRSVLELGVRVSGTRRQPVDVELYWERRSLARTGSFPVSGAAFMVSQPAFTVDDTGLRLSFPLTD